VAAGRLVTPSKEVCWGFLSSQNSSLGLKTPPQTPPPFSNPLEATFLLRSCFKWTFAFFPSKSVSFSFPSPPPGSFLLFFFFRDIALCSAFLGLAICTFPDLCYASKPFSYSASAFASTRVPWLINDVIEIIERFTSLKVPSPPPIAPLILARCVRVLTFL